MSLYDILEVARDATEAEIRKAHRKAVLQHHPDKGGDREAFDRVQKAYEVLSDPERRARYDATGDIDDPEAQMQREAIGLVVQVFDKVVKGLDPVHTDPVRKSQEHLGHGLGELKERVKQTKAAQAKLEVVRDRLAAKGPGADGLLEGALDERARNLAEHLSNLQAGISIHERAIKLLNAYSYRTDPKKNPYETSVADALRHGYGKGGVFAQYIDPVAFFSDGSAS